MSLAREERKRISATFLAVGPEAPTLCEGWDAYDLAAHLWIRENEPLARLTAAVRRRPEQARMNVAKARLPFQRMVGQLRTGPRSLTPLRIPAVDRLANGFEYFVHHEDLRRAGEQPLPPRRLSPAAERELWVTLKRMSRLMYRRSPFGVDLETRDGLVLPVGKGRKVTVVGEVSELALFSAGRVNAADVDLLGDAAEIERLIASLGI